MKQILQNLKNVPTELADVPRPNPAEDVSVPASLCAAVPDAVTDEEAACTVLGAIALQGVRLAEPTLGSYVAKCKMPVGIPGFMDVGGGSDCVAFISCARRSP